MRWAGVLGGSDCVVRLHSEDSLVRVLLRRDYLAVGISDHYAVSDEESANVPGLTCVDQCAFVESWCVLAGLVALKQRGIGEHIGAGLVDHNVLAVERAGGR